MTTRNSSRKWKLAVKIALACVLALDGALILVNARAATVAPQSQALERNRLAQKEKLLAADVAKGHAIEQHLPNVGEECDTFYQRNLLQASSGYSTVISDIGQMAKSAGVQISGVGFHETAVKDRGLSEVQMTAAVQGDYQSLIRLINNLEHSPHFYVLDGLTLASESSGSIKLNVTLRTYFRT
ncbi:MAG: hypothetical protein ACYC92_05985 [Candidatus Acidiferrales bacterium]